MLCLFEAETSDPPRVDGPGSLHIPTMWLQYVTVDDCDETLTRAKQNGATVIAEPVDAEGVGRFCILRDPLGGMIGVIRPVSA